MRNEKSDERFKRDTRRLNAMAFLLWGIGYAIVVANIAIAAAG
jgi:hypothetical protein